MKPHRGLEVTSGRPGDPVALRGFNAAQTRSAFVGAHALCKRTGDEAMFILVLRGIYNTHFVRGEGREVAERVLELAHRAKDGCHFGHACAALGSNLFYRGELAAAREVLEKAVADVGGGRHPVQAHHVLIDIKTAALMNLSWTLWTLGHPDQAVEIGRQAITAARESAQPFPLAAALTWVCSVRLCCKQTAVVEQLHHELSAVAHKHRLAPWGDCAMFIEGEPMAENVELEAGQVSLHHVNIIHGSNANRSAGRRAGWAIRYMPATSLFDRSIPPTHLTDTQVVDYASRPIWLVRGIDRAGNDFRVGHIAA